MSVLKVIILGISFIFLQSAIAAENIPLPPSIDNPKTTAKNNDTPPPSLPDEADDSRNIPQPEVTIIKKKDTVIEEYRTHGHLRYVKITPKGGKPYYMVDTDGDGVLEQWDTTRGNPPINRWILLEW
jgi:hypothetical protein